MVNLPEATKHLLSEIKRRPISALAASRTKLKRAGQNQYVALCPFHSEKTPSFRVYDAKGTFKCFGCGEHGDAVTFLQRLDNLRWKTALENAAAFYGLAADVNNIRKQKYQPVEAMLSPDEEREHRLSEEEKAREMWRQGVSAGRTVVEAYLREVRGIPLELLQGGEIPPSLRLHKECPYWATDEKGKPRLIGKYPAMIAPLQRADGIQVGIHITFLNPSSGEKLQLELDGQKLPAKKMRGTSWATAIRLAPAATKMSCAEGIENTLSAMCYGMPNGWAAGSLNNLAGFGIGEGLPHPRRIDRRLPPAYPDMTRDSFRLSAACETVRLIRDNDGKDQESADELFERFLRRMKALGVKTEQYIPPKGMDMNDELQATLAEKRKAAQLELEGKNDAGGA